MVMEAFLIMNDIIKPNPNPNPDNIFTIQKYFNGEYLHYTPEPRIQTYVRFDLPTTEDMLYVDSLFSCLLYTSPSPRDLSTSRMPSSA